MGQTISLEIPDDVREAIHETSERTGRGFSVVASEMLSEAVRMRQFPGILFDDGPVGRVARIAGTDTSVGDVIAAYNRSGRDPERFRRARAHLDQPQLELALSYWRAHREQVEEQMDVEMRHAIEAVWEQYPMTRPRSG